MVSVSSWAASPASGSRSRWRRRPVGDSLPMSSDAVGAECTSPSRRRRVRCPAARSAETDRADARHLRELLMVGRLPEGWIAPAHLLDLRARVRLRQTLVDPRGERQQRIHAVLYPHGVANARRAHRLAVCADCRVDAATWPTDARLLRG